MKRKYEVVYSSKFLPYSTEDTWDIVFRFMLPGAVPGMKTVGAYKTKKRAEEVCKKLNKEVD